jgi:hypothetical protein
MFSNRFTIPLKVKPFKDRMYFSYDSKYLYLLLADSTDEDRIIDLISFDLATLKETSSQMKFDFSSNVYKGTDSHFFILYSS